MALVAEENLSYGFEVIYIGDLFYTLTPCRLIACSIPETAKSVSVNLTATQATNAGNLRTYPAGIAPPIVSMINYTAGVTRANNAIVTLNASGQFAILAQPVGTVHFILDVNGYFE